MSTSSQIVFSVVIPVFNRAKELARAIDSVLIQKEQHFEIIVVDDSSTEDIKSVVSSYGDARLKYIALSEKSNANVARNEGIQNANGEYIALLDSDDQWKENHLSSRLEILEKQPQVHGLFGSFLINNKVERQARDLNKNESMLDYLLTSNPSGTPTLVIRSECAKDILFDPKIERHQDYDFLVRFTDKYVLQACSLMTVIVNWEPSETIKTNFKACMYFIEKYKQRISPKTYHYYHRAMFHKAKSQGAGSEIIRHYKEEGVRYKKFLSLTDLMDWLQPKSVIEKVKIRIGFLLENLK